MKTTPTIKGQCALASKISHGRRGFEKQPRIRRIRRGKEENQNERQKATKEVGTE